MEASKAADAYGMIRGHIIEQADAVQAYIQAKLQGPATTWVMLPHDQWPASWRNKYRTPVVPLLLALYGHPDSGGVLGAALRNASQVPGL